MATFLILFKKQANFLLKGEVIWQASDSSLTKDLHSLANITNHYLILRVESCWEICRNIFQEERIEPLEEWMIEAEVKRLWVAHRLLKFADNVSSGSNL